MNFDLESFVATNKRVFIWTVFFLLLYLVRRLFGLVFLTFILCFIFNNLIDRLSRWSRLPRRIWTVIIYAVFLAVVITTLSFIGPKVVNESTSFLKQVPQTLEKLRGMLDQLTAQQPQIELLTEKLKYGLTLENLLGTSQDKLLEISLASLNRLTHYFSWFLLGVLFSFLILFDYPRLKAAVLALRQSRLKDIFEETAASVIQFALVVGANFQAQILIACVNTMLTATGLWILNIKPIILLSTVVFFAGLIPVLGTFISSVPILLVAINSGGPGLMFWALVMIIFVHTVEAYILNPNIISVVMKINPVLILIILYIGHTLFGLWGVLLGVPVSVYIYRYIVLASISERGPREQARPEPEKSA